MTPCLLRAVFGGEIKSFMAAKSMAPGIEVYECVRRDAASIAAAKRWQPARPHSFIHGTRCPCMVQSLQMHRVKATPPTGPSVKK